MNRLIILLGLLIISFNLNSQTPDSISTSHVPEQNYKAKSEIDIYKILYEETKQQNTDVLDIFKWAVGSIIIILLAIFGSNIFFNFRFNKKELENLLQQIELKIQKIKDSSLEEINEKTSELEDDFNIKSQKLRDDFEKLQKETITVLVNENKQFIEKVENILAKTTNRIDLFVKETNTKIDQSNKDLSETYQKQLLSFNENYTQQIETLNKSFNTQIKSLISNLDKQDKLVNERIEQKNATILALLEKKESELKEDVKSVERRFNYVEKQLKQDAARIKINLWDNKGVYANSLTYRIEELSYIIDLGWDIEWYLEGLIKNLQQLEKLYNSDCDNIQKLLDKTETGKYETLKHKILEIIAEKPKK